MTEETPAEPRRRKEDVRWSAGLGRRLCARVAKGELLYHVLRGPGMPTPEAVAKWAKARPAFGAALAAARAEGGRTAASRGPASTYNEGVAREVFERLCEGESLRAIGRDPTMPGLSTLYHWRERMPAFDRMVRTARRIQAERLCDLGLEMAMEATPETAYLTHVRLNQLRWTAGVLSPNQFASSWSSRRRRAPSRPGSRSGSCGWRPTPRPARTRWSPTIPIR